MKYLSYLCLVLLFAYAFANDEDMETYEAHDEGEEYNPEFSSFFTYYRQSQQKHSWQTAIKKLKTDHTKISVENRVELITNAFAQAKNGDLDYSTVFELTEYLEKEQDFLPWNAALESFAYVKSMMTSTSHYELYKQHMQRILKPICTQVGFEKKMNEDEEITQMRSMVMSSACAFKNQDCVSHSTHLFKQWMENQIHHDVIPIELKRTVMCTAIREGGVKEWNFAHKLYKESEEENEKFVYLNAMACTRDPGTLSKMLGWSIDTKSEFSTKEASTIIHHVAANTIGRCMTFNFVRNHWDEISARFSKSSSNMKRIVTAVSNTINTKVEFEEFEKFIDHQTPSLTKVTKVVEECVNQTKKNCEWKENNYPKVCDWLDRKYSYDN